MSTVDYRQWDADDRVSTEWHVVLTAARRDGVAFMVTDGHRTMAEQRDRFAVFQRFGRPLAARPSPTAPHIRTGRADHAIDVNALDGGAGRLAAWLRRKGAKADVPRPRRAVAHRGAAAPISSVSPGRSATRSPVSRTRSAAGSVPTTRSSSGSAPGATPPRRCESRVRLRGLMTARRKAIWHAAQESGWNRLHRSARYEALKSRTR